MADKPLYNQMSALLTYANGITGACDTHLGDAVRSLADGYGGGGGTFVGHASGTWIAETLTYRQFIIMHNIGISAPQEYTYIIRLAATDKEHVYTANNIFTMGVCVLTPTTQRDRDGYIRYNSTTVDYPKGDMTGVLLTWFSGSGTPGSNQFYAESTSSNNSYIVNSNSITLGLGLRGCEVGLSYDWEIYYFKTSEVN